MKTWCLATAVALSINLFLYIAGRLAGWIPEGLILSASQAPLTETPVLFATLLGCLGAGLVWLIFKPFSFSRNGFWILSSLLLLASFLPPLSLDAPVTTIVLLELMHLGAALPLMFWLPKTLTRAGERHDLSR